MPRQRSTNELESIKDIRSDGGRDNAGTPVAFRDVTGTAKAWEGNEEGPYVVVKGKEPVKDTAASLFNIKRTGSDPFEIESAWQTSEAIDVRGWDGVTFYIAIDVSGESGELDELQFKFIFETSPFEDTSNVKVLRVQPWFPTAAIGGSFAIITKENDPTGSGRANLAYRNLYESGFQTPACTTGNYQYAAKLPISVEEDQWARLKWAINADYTFSGFNFQVFYVRTR